MNDRVMALRVGIVLLAAGFITGFLIILLGEGRTFLQGRYGVHIRFPNAPGVAVDTPVRKSGVLIGRVTHVDLKDEGGVVITARIEDGRKIFKDEICVIKPSTLLGDSVLEFVPKAGTGQPHEAYQDGDFIGNGMVSADPLNVLTNLEGDVRETLGSFKKAADDVSAVSSELQKAIGPQENRLQQLMDTTDRALNQFSRTAEALNEVIGDPQVRANLKEGIAQLPKTMNDMQMMMAETRQMMDGFKGMQERVEKNLANIEPFTQMLGEQGDEIVVNFKKIAENFESISSIGADLAERISNADGSLAKLIRDDDLYDQVFETVRNFRDASRKLPAIMNDVRVLSDKLATDPRQLGVKGAFDRRPSGVGIKGVPNVTELRQRFPEGE